MTANRWWVKLAARWLARFDTTKGQLQAFSLSITAFSTFSLVLQNAGLEGFIPYIGVFGVVGWLIYTFLYSEGGVFNQKQRDMSDLGGNYSGPSMLIDDILQAVAWFTVMHGRAPTDDEYEQIKDAVVATWQEYRNGVPEEYLNDD